MYGNHFVGRVEFENYRTAQPLVVKQLWWQEGARLSKSFINAYNRELKLFAKYLGATQIEGEING